MERRIAVVVSVKASRGKKNRVLLRGWREIWLMYDVRRPFGDAYLSIFD